MGPDGTLAEAEHGGPAAGADGGARGATVLAQARCPRCGEGMDAGAPAPRCDGCGQTYPRLGDVPVLLTQPERYLGACRHQLSALEAQTDSLVRSVREALYTPGLLAGTRFRLEGMMEAAQGQLREVGALLDPLLPVHGAPAGDDAPATLSYLPLLHRDWGSAHGAESETALATAAVERVLGGRSPGRTLVLGAGAGRLAYDLAMRAPDSEWVLLDVDPVLVLAARIITGGGRVALREANLEVGELAQGARTCVLEAPLGPMDAERFHLLIADGVEPPFAPGTFDTVLTPWFLDQGPADLRDFIGTVHRLLRPGGRWVNTGPLLYDEQVPLALRFGREELFELARRAGFRVDAWHTESAPYLVSALNGRGKVEWVLSFAATRHHGEGGGAARADAPEAEPGAPPAWLVFPHLPIPTFPGQESFRAESPAMQMVVAAIDGRRTVDDIARHLARQARRPDVTLVEIRGAVRQFLAEVHPACRTGGRA